MDDNSLNIHLSSLCNSLTDAATDAIKVCVWHQFMSLPLGGGAFYVSCFRAWSVDRETLAAVGAM